MMLELKSNFFMFLQESHFFASQSSQICFCEKHSSQSQVIVLCSPEAQTLVPCTCSLTPLPDFCLRLSWFPAHEIGSVLSHVLYAPRLSFDKQCTLPCLFVLILSCYCYIQTLYKSIWHYTFIISYLGAASRLSFLEIVFGLRLQQGQLPSTR